MKKVINGKKKTNKKMYHKKTMAKGGKMRDNNLANNYPPYDKITRGDVIAGRLGKDQMGGKNKMAKGGNTNEGADAKNLKILTALNGYNEGLTIQGLLENMGLSNYRFGKYASPKEKKSVEAALKKLISKGYVEKGGLGYKITQEGANWRRENYSKYAKGGMTEHGLKSGDKIVGKSGTKGVKVYNKQSREAGSINLDSGKRSVSKYEDGGMMAKGGSTKVNLGSGEMDLEDAIKMYENKIKSQGSVTNERDENMLKQLKSMRPKMAKGGGVGDIMLGDKVKIKSGYSQHDNKNAEVVRIMPNNKTLELKIKHKSGNEYVKFEKSEVEKFAKGGKTKSKQDPPVIRGYVDDEPYEYGDGGTMNCWCYEIGGL